MQLELYCILLGVIKVVNMIGKGSEPGPVLSLGKVKELLEQRKKKGELTYEQQLAEEHAKKFASGSDSAADKMVKAFLELGMSEAAAVKLADILPKNAMTAKQILMHENKTFSEEEISKILSIIKGGGT
jgi:DNA-directed RNA polymerase subunit F